MPAPGDLLARTCASARSVSVMRSTSTSTLPPVILWPARRALMTRVSLNTSRSPGRNSPSRSANWRSCSWLAPSRCSSRLPVRWAAGVCAMSSGGSS
ncbi:hypothetical protein CNMCM8686_001561 [Aspergillus fumigatus]|nr:hypothetical protein CNMCM8686_001561 [Aspergillus fumigatus]